MNAVHQTATLRSFPKQPFQARKQAIGLYSLSTTIGEGNADVHCTYDMNSDGEVFNIAVHDGLVNVTKYLAGSQLECLEVECYDSYLVEVKENNLSRRINEAIASVRMKEWA